MSKKILNIREVDRNIFDMIQSGKKTVETRAATRKFIGIKVNDVLIFKCGKDMLEKQVIEKYTFKSIEDLYKSIDIKEIMPYIDSKEKAIKVWYSFPNYKEKTKKYGLVAFRLN